MKLISFDEIELILLYTNWYDILNFCKTCKKYKSFLSNKDFWYNKYKIDYDPHIKYELFNTSPFKTYIKCQNGLSLKFLSFVIAHIGFYGEEIEPNIYEILDSISCYTKEEFLPICNIMRINTSYTKEKEEMFNNLQSKEEEFNEINRKILFEIIINAIINTKLIGHKYVRSYLYSHKDEYTITINAMNNKSEGKKFVSLYDIIENIFRIVKIIDKCIGIEFFNINKHNDDFICSDLELKYWG